MFKIKITETLERDVFIDAPCLDEAVEIAENLCNDGVVSLNDNDFKERFTDVVAINSKPNMSTNEKDEVYGKEGKLQPYDITFARTGCAIIFAEDEEDALSKANILSEEEVSWTDNFNATDANWA